MNEYVGINGVKKDNKNIVLMIGLLLMIMISFFLYVERQKRVNVAQNLKVVDFVRDSNTQIDDINSKYLKNIRQQRQQAQQEEQKEKEGKISKNPQNKLQKLFQHQN